jgi:hypothetical protein
MGTRHLTFIRPAQCFAFDDHFIWDSRTISDALKREFRKITTISNAKVEVKQR